MNRSLFLPDEAATLAFGQALAKACAGKGMLTLSGNLGSGKTTLSRGIIRAYGYSGAVKSPTYTLVEPYDLKGQRIYHFDLYRMEDPEELEFIGLRDYLEEDALLLIEWPEKAGEVLPVPDIELRIESENKGRMISWLPRSPLGEEIASRLEAAL